MMNKSKEELQKQLKAIEEQEDKEMIEKHYPEFKKLEGTFYKKQNCFSCPEKPSDYWYFYTKIVEITPDDLIKFGNEMGISSYFKGWAFQTKKNGTFSVETECLGHVHSLGTRITENEFNTAWNKAMSALDGLK